MTSKIVDDWSVLDIYITNLEKLTCDTYNNSNFECQFLNV